ncbi:MAG TPA: DegV family protein [Acholeplasmataceae bacterium]|jgi:DegV family protein with EDD domain|nr:DegV family protein [Acholeplasmataceae bacterium]
MKNKVLILTDSTADLPQHLIESRDIKVIPLYIHLGEKELLDGIDITADEMFEWINANGVLPQTATVSPFNFEEFLRPYINDGYDVFYSGIGGLLSGTGRNFLLAAEEFPKERIYYLDSGNLSSGIAIIILKACDLRDKGYSAKEIYEELKDLPPRVHSQFVIRTLDYMRKGGRATGFQALMGAALKIRPVLRVRDGKLFLYKKAMGKMSRGMDIQIDDFLAEYDKGNIVDDYLFITHAQNPKMYEYTMKRLKKHGVKIKNIYEGQAGCVISSHCGPGTIGILYEVKEYKKE